MAKIDELIQKLCPNGVEYKTLSEICIVKTGKGITKKDSSDDGIFPIISGGLEPMGYYHIYNREKDTVTISRVGVNAGFVNYITEQFYLNDKCFSVIPVPNYLERLDTKYLFYALKSVEEKIVNLQSEGGVPTINTQKVYSISIPVPPIEVQDEIVRILDNFTELTAELIAELTAELEDRKKQYEYYRYIMLTFDENNHKVEYYKIGDVCKLSAGGDVPKGEYSKEKSSQYCIPIYSNGIGENAIYGYTCKSKINEPCVTIAARGTIGYCALRKEPFYPVVRLICAIPKEILNVSYLKYILETIKFAIPLSGIPQLTVPMISNYTIPVPPLEEQERIVSILDRFDALCNDITKGLPAEIEARKKQYEYYRDKLLTFKRLQSEAEELCEGKDRNAV